MTNSINETDRHECEECHKLLFRGSIRLLLTKSAEAKDTIEVKCSRCGHLNIFTPQPQVLK